MIKLTPKYNFVRLPITIDHVNCNEKCDIFCLFQIQLISKDCWGSIKPGSKSNDPGGLGHRSCTFQPSIQSLDQLDTGHPTRWCPRWSLPARNRKHQLDFKNVSNTSYGFWGKMRLPLGFDDKVLRDTQNPYMRETHTADLQNGGEMS